MIADPWCADGSAPRVDSLRKGKIGCETNQDKEGNDETEDNDIGFGDYLRERGKRRPDMGRSAMGVTC